MVDIQSLLRTNIKNLKPYSSARDEFKGAAEIFIDANENPFDHPYSRYPDPLQWKLKEKIAQFKQVDPQNIFLGNGSDEPIDLVIRAFCNPGVDEIISPNPSYGMYKVSADINDVKLIQVPLRTDFTMDFDLMLATAGPQTKVAFLCSPNNPSGNVLPVEEMKNFIRKFNGLVVIDEAYIDFSARFQMKKFIMIITI